MIQINMDKPENCWECPFAIEIDDSWVKGYTCLASYYKYGFVHFHTPEEAMWLYLKRCPLIEVKDIKEDNNETD